MHVLLKEVIMKLNEKEKRCLQQLALLARKGRYYFSRDEIISELNIYDDNYNSFMRKAEGMFDIKVHGTGNQYEAFNINRLDLLQLECEKQGVECCKKCNHWTRIETTEKGKCQTSYKVSDYSTEKPELKNEHLETDAYYWCDSYKPIIA